MNGWVILVGFLAIPAVGTTYAVLGLDGSIGSYANLAGWLVVGLAFASFWSLQVRRAWPWVRCPRAEAPE